MAKAIEYLAGAHADFDESFDWYSKHSTGAAIGFVSGVDEAIERISADPSRSPSTYGGCHYCTLK